jgi:Heavy metal associated domain 2
VAPRESETVASALTVAHDIPGRLRLRLPRAARIEGITDTIDRLPGAHGCVWSPRTRSLLIHYESDALTSAEIARVVAEHANISPPVLADGSGVGDGRPAVAAAVVETVSELNQGIARRTRGRLDLGLLVPLALTLWALRQLLRGPVRPLEWSSALWYAHGLFRDYAAPTRER